MSKQNSAFNPCKLAKVIIKVKTRKDFHKFLEQLESKHIEVLLEVFINAEKIATSPSEKKLISKHHNVLGSAVKQIFKISAAKRFLTKHFSLLKKLLAAFAFNNACRGLATFILDNGQDI